MNLYSNITVEEQADILARFFESHLYIQEESNLRIYLEAIAIQFLLIKEKGNELKNELWFETTDKLLEEWEALLGIPHCGALQVDRELRLKEVLLQFVGLQKNDRLMIKRVAEILELEINVYSGYEKSVIPFTLPGILLSAEEMPYTLVLEIQGDSDAVIPQIIPFIIGAGTQDLAKCIIEKLLDSNLEIVYV